MWHAALPHEASIPGLALLPDLEQQPVAFGLHTFEQEPPEVDAGRHLGPDLGRAGALRLHQRYEHVGLAGLSPKLVGLEARGPQLVASVSDFVGHLLDTPLEVADQRPSVVPRVIGDSGGVVVGRVIRGVTGGDLSLLQPFFRYRHKRATVVPRAARPFVTHGEPLGALGRDAEGEPHIFVAQPAR